MGNNLINENYIRLEQDIHSQKELFELVAQLAIEQKIATNKAEIIVGLKQREKESTTGFQDGFAIPHTQLDTIVHPSILVITTKMELEWSSMDGQPARFFIILLIPKDQAGSTHIKALASVSKMLIHSENREILKNSKNKEEIYQLLQDWIS
ncbi:PTS sugar transporter subunit IIA [Paraliobacillus sp. JSM ZJ581]|uniref:PTS sugar transporter subunit IIA n=1 Tax=Paraliobacillus sp. JSM ZJ581 TaxID=3342118 RepID=UPI0035A953BE